MIHPQPHNPTSSRGNYAKKNKEKLSPISVRTPDLLLFDFPLFQSYLSPSQSNPSTATITMALTFLPRDIMTFLAIAGTAFAGTYCRCGLVGTRNNVENSIGAKKVIMFYEAQTKHHLTNFSIIFLSCYAMIHGHVSNNQRSYSQALSDALLGWCSMHYLPNICIRTLPHKF